MYYIFGMTILYRPNHLNYDVPCFLFTKLSSFLLNIISESASRDVLHDHDYSAIWKLKNIYEFYYIFVNEFLERLSLLEHFVCLAGTFNIVGFDDFHGIFFLSYYMLAQVNLAKASFTQFLHFLIDSIEKIIVEGLT